MKTLKRTLYSLALLLGVMASTGCNDFLDLSPTDAVTDKVVWSDPAYATLYVNNFYPYISYFGQYSTWQCYPGLTDGLTETLKYGSPADNMTGIHYGMASRFIYGIDAQTASSAAFYLSKWNDFYEAVRRVNEFLFSMQKFASFDEPTTLRFQAEARFFRGMLYFELVKRHKSVILYDENMEAYAPDMPLTAESDCWEFVYQDLKFAAEHLPTSWGAADAGRVTSGAAWALLSRAMLYAERWQDALDAANAVFALNQYSLMPGSSSEMYAKCFSTNAASGNTESILEYSYLQGKLDHNFNYIFSPGGDGSNYARALATPTQEMVECYEKKGGGKMDWSPWHVNGGTLEEPPYTKLEPRFGASILYNGASWKGREIEAFEGGTDGWCAFGTYDTKGMTTTGYFLRKLVDEKHTDLVTLNSTQPWIAIRLAEVHLNRAEAAYRVGGQEAQANADLKAVRERVGLPHSDLSGEELFAAIRQERKVELAFEGHLFWDMCRWKLAHTEYNGMRVHGLKISAEAGMYRYTYVECDTQDRFFTEKYYQVPIPEDELASNQAIEQYPIWQ